MRIELTFTIYVLTAYQAGFLGTYKMPFKACKTLSVKGYVFKRFIGIQETRLNWIFKFFWIEFFRFLFRVWYGL